MDFFDSLPGQYVAQSVLHSLIIAAVVEAMLHLWRVHRPYLKIKFRFLVVALPLICLPLFFMLYPPRTGISFRQAALFDHSRWLGLEIGAGIYVGHLFLATLAVTTAYFIGRDLVPAWRHHRRRHRLQPVAEGQFPRLDAVLFSLAKTAGLAPPLVRLATDDSPVIYTLGRRTLVLSAAALDLLDSDELEVVIAHEMAHLDRKIYRVTHLAAALRFLTLYNPVALAVFHRIINDSERHCDDAAVQVTGKRLALASGLLKVYRQTSGLPADAPPGVPRHVTALEHRAHASLIRERLVSLAHPDSRGDVPYPDFRLLLVTVLLLGLLFFVV